MTLVILGRFDVPTVVGGMGGEVGVLILAMVKFSKSPKHPNLHFLQWGECSGTCNGKIA